MATRTFNTVASQENFSTTHFVEDANALYQKNGISFLIEDGLVKQLGDDNE